MKSFRQYLSESSVHDHVNNFVDYACKHLNLEIPPKVSLIDDKNEAAGNRSFGSYTPSDHSIKVNIAGRHTADVLRTLAHELVHHRQNLDGRLDDVAVAGETGSDCENDANSQAGIIMRNYGRANHKIYEEASKPRGDETLHAFDVDGTLMHTTARVQVRRDSDNERTHTLSHDEFNSHKLAPGTHYDFSEFRSAKHFDTEKPIKPMLAKLKAIQNNVQKKGKGRVIINTARSDFDDKHHFARAWNKFGVDIGKVHVERAGNIETKQSVAEKKAKIMQRHLDSNRYKEVHFYDDDKQNLNHFLKLKKKYPHINFRAHLAHPNGSTSKYHGETE